LVQYTSFQFKGTVADFLVCLVMSSPNEVSVRLADLDRGQILGRQVGQDVAPGHRTAAAGGS
ncbi:MAG TPA: hypothetical protein PLD86_19415, partial [Vicinamibacteria bacterium]|nr:hypothetical protein [Vicinamibacteria bacterium]